MTIKPLGERVLVKMDKVEEKTAGGIFIPQTAQEKTQIAVVEAIGDEVKTVKVGEPRALHSKIMVWRLRRQQLSRNGYIPCGTDRW